MSCQFRSSDSTDWAIETNDNNNKTASPVSPSQMFDECIFKASNGSIRILPMERERISCLRINFSPASARKRVQSEFDREFSGAFYVLYQW
jgi:hypothetical protein